MLADSTQRGARSRNIKAIYVENNQGERFKYPYNHLSGARAMQRHVANGGLPYDTIGESIIQMSCDIAALKKFNSQSHHLGLTEGNSASLVEKSQHRINQLRETMKRLSGQRFYQQYVENFNMPETESVDYTEFVNEYNLAEHSDLADVVPVLYKLANEHSVLELGYKDVVSKLPVHRERTVNNVPASELETLESWILSLGEDSAITSNDAEEKSQAVAELNDVIKDRLPAGVDGINAIESLSGIIEDDELFDFIKEKSKLDPDFDTRGLIKTWVEENEPDVLSKLDFGDYDTTELVKGSSKGSEKSEPSSDSDTGTDVKKEPETKETSKTKESQDEPVDNKQPKNVNLQELAEFIHSFYDQSSSTFPRGPEGVCIMVSKKYGRRAEEVARKLVSRMAPEQKDAVPDETSCEIPQPQVSVNNEPSFDFSILKRLSGLA